MAQDETLESMGMGHRLSVFALGMALGLFGLSQRGLEAAEGPLHGSDGDRRFLRSTKSGALSAPMAITDFKKANWICRALERPSQLRAGVDAVARGTQRHAQKKRRAEALRRVYVATTDPDGFQFEDYRVEDRLLPLKVSRSFMSFRGGLRMNILGRRLIGFPSDVAQAQSWAKKRQEKSLLLRLVFRVDAEPDNTRACFALPKSDGVVMHVVPMSLELIDAHSRTVLVRHDTPEKEALHAWLYPAPPKLRVSVEVTKTKHADRISTRVRDAIRGQAAGLESCFASAGNARSGSLFTFVGQLSLRGRLTDLTLALATSREEAVAPCLSKALSTLVVGTVPSTSSLRITLSLAKN